MCVVNIAITVYMYCNYNVITITNVTFLLTHTICMCEFHCKAYGIPVRYVEYQLDTYVEYQLDT